MMKLCKSCHQDYTKIIPSRQDCSVCYWRAYNKERWQQKKKDNPKATTKYLRNLQKKYREKNKDKIKQYANTYNEKHKEKIAEYQKKYYLEKILPKRRATRKYVYEFEQLSVAEMKKLIDIMKTQITEAKK